MVFCIFCKCSKNLDFLYLYIMFLLKFINYNRNLQEKEEVLVEYKRK